MFLSSACASSTSKIQLIEVEGEVWKRGHEPFAEYILTSDQQNHYVLRWEEPADEGMATPARVRVEGTVYLGEWNGEPFTFLRVSLMEVLE